MSTSQTINYVGTSNEVNTDWNNGTQTLTIGLPDNVTIAGNLTVNGTLTTVNTDNLVVEDPLIKLGNGNAADSVDLGLYWQWTATGAKYGGMFRDSSDANDAITFFELLEVEPTTTVNTAGAGYTLADMKFGTVREGTWQGTIVGVTYGGTGVADPAAGSILLIVTGKQLW